MKKLHISLNISKLKVNKITFINILRMRSFIANFVRILGICKEFAGNHVNGLGNIPCCGVVPKFTDLEVIALSITAESFGFDSENYLFHRLHHECKNDLPYLISRSQFNTRRKKLCRFTEDIRRDIANHIDEGEDVFCIDSKPIKVCRKKRANLCTMGADNVDSMPELGYCPSQKSYYFGYKLHSVCGIRGVVHPFDFTPASVHDIHAICQLSQSSAVG